MKRPSLLSIFCILTFVGSGWGIFSSITNYNNAEMVVGLSSEIMENARDQIENEAENENEIKIVDKILDSVSSGLIVQNIQRYNIASGISCLITLIGAILMWGLDKRGFWLYVAGTLVGIVAAVVIYTGWLGVIVATGWAVVGLAFCTVFGLNLKYMH